MASGDEIAVDWSRANIANFRVTISGITGDIPLTNLTVDAPNNLWSAEPVGGWPNLTGTSNGNPAAPGSLQVITGTSKVVDVEGNELAAGTVVFSRPIQIPLPAKVGTLVAAYQSGLGTAGVAITTAGSLGSSPLVVRVTSTEN